MDDLTRGLTTRAPTGNPLAQTPGAASAPTPTATPAPGQVSAQFDKTAAIAKRHLANDLGTQAAALDKMTPAEILALYGKSKELLKELPAQWKMKDGGTAIGKHLDRSSILSVGADGKVAVADAAGTANGPPITTGTTAPSVKITLQTAPPTQADPCGVPDFRDPAAGVPWLKSKGFLTVAIDPQKMKESATAAVYEAAVQRTVDSVKAELPGAIGITGTSLRNKLAKVEKDGYTFNFTNGSARLVAAGHASDANLTTRRTRLWNETFRESASSASEIKQASVDFLKATGCVDLHAPATTEAEIDALIQEGTAELVKPEKLAIPASYLNGSQKTVYERIWKYAGDVVMVGGIKKPSDTSPGGLRWSTKVAEAPAEKPTEPAPADTALTMPAMAGG